MNNDLQIARAAKMLPIAQVAQKLGVDADNLEQYGKYKAKLSREFTSSCAGRQPGKLVLVTAISPTPAGEGKTTTTIGLSDALNALGKRSICCLREPSLGPCFGIKGGAAGGGHAQVVPMTDINLHFTGDFHAIGAAHNLLAATLDNHLHWGNKLNINPKKIAWRRVVDMNDRALRDIAIGLGSAANSMTRQSGFDITVASEVMAIFCLASSLEDLHKRLERIVVAYDYEDKAVTAGDLGVVGAMTALLADAFMPNLVQTLENNPAFIHGGPFANIAHGCNSLIATRTALQLADYVVTEAGFGADLGAEKFLDIKLPQLQADLHAVVLVASVRALKMHGGLGKAELSKPNPGALRQGLVNLNRHLENLHNFGVRAVVCINAFSSDSAEEHDIIKQNCASLGTSAHVCTHWADGGKGATALAEEVIQLAVQEPQALQRPYQSSDSLWDKTSAIARKIYRARDIIADMNVHKSYAYFQENYGELPVCMAKTPASFSVDPQLIGAPENHEVNVRELRLAAGAGFVVAVCGSIMTMPGLPRKPSAENIYVDASGSIEGLF